jgi:hypothetical protein
MPVDVFEGGAGNLVLCQEWPSLHGELYLRILLPMAEARQLAEAILAVECAAANKKKT